MKTITTFLFSALIVSSAYAAGPLQASIDHEMRAGASVSNSVRNARAQSAQGIDVSRIISQCREVRASEQLQKIAADVDSQSPARQRALTMLERRCADFADGELTDTAERETIFNAIQAADPQTLAVTQFIDATRQLSTLLPAERRSLVANVLALQDAVAIDDLGIRLFLHRSPNGAVAYFQGEEYLLTSDPDISYSVPLVKCELGHDCGPSEREVLTTCIYQGKCVGTLYELVEERAVTAGKDALVVKQMAKEIASAVRRSDVDAFVRN
ncbi:hypothetical protein [Comamonas sp.]|uniref:hypothetical protein n=1 Tax=Comamonas sp. TaxID=34028 RepID=UPI002589ACD5|nr:hypothetical protein [Comamonas sp.]